MQPGELQAKFVLATAFKLEFTYWVQGSFTTGAGQLKELINSIISN
jgi:hypothetical protein